MSMYCKFQWTIECDDCPTDYDGNTVIHGTEFGVSDDEQHEMSNDLLETLNEDGWEVVRQSYESHSFLCPRCVEKEKAIAEFEKEQKRRKLEPLFETEGA